MSEAAKRCMTKVSECASIIGPNGQPVTAENPGLTPSGFPEPKGVDYNQIYQTAAENRDDKQEAGDTWAAMAPAWVEMVGNAIEKGRQAGWRKFYVHIYIQKDTITNQVMRWVPMVRRTRPSPYKSWDHYLYKWNDDVGVTFEWSVPRPEVATHVANNPSQFPGQYVDLMRKYCMGTLV